MQESSRTYGIDKNMLLMPLLATVSHAMDNTVVHIGGNWKEPVNLFTLVLSPPGGGKSPAVNQILLNPLRKIKQAEKDDEDMKTPDQKDLRERVWEKCVQVG